MTIIIFILVLLVTVMVHEWGHFYAARKSGMRVEEFGFGIPPKLFGIKKGETEYSINALPIGGFVKISGENGIDDSVPLDRQFETKPWYLKSYVLVAGVACNILLAIVLFTAAYTVGMPSVSEGGEATIISVLPNTPAEDAGLETGDIVRSVTVGGQEAPDLSTDSLREMIKESAQPVVIAYERNSEVKTANLTPAEGPNGYSIGLAIEPVKTVKEPFFTALTRSPQRVFVLVGDILEVLGQLLRGIFVKDTADTDLMGPVGLAKQVGNASTFGFGYLLAFTAAISVNLAVLNIMPFPALDGGRLIVVLLEAVTRRRFSQKVVGFIHAGGFVILLGLMLVLTVSDIRNLL